MNQADELDELLDTVLEGWTTRRPPEGFNARCVAAAMHNAPKNTPFMPAKPSNSLLLPIVGFVAAAAAVVVVLMLGRAEPVQPVPPVSTPAPFDRARAQLEFCKIAADIEAANERFPFDPDGSDLSWSRFLELYGPTGRVAVWEAGVTMTDAPVSPSAQAVFDHARELRITLFGDAWERVPRLPLELQPAVTDPKQRADVLDRSQAPRCTLSIGPRDYKCGPVQPALWQAGHDDDVTLTFRDRGGLPTGTVTSSGPWALLRFLRLGDEMEFEQGSRFRGLHFEAEGSEPLQLVYRWMAGVESQQTQQLLTNPVPVPSRLFAGDPPCDSP